MRYIFKKALSVLITLCFVFTLLPATVFAAAGQYTVNSVNPWQDSYTLQNGDSLIVDNTAAANTNSDTLIMLDTSGANPSTFTLTGVLGQNYQNVRIFITGTNPAIVKLNDFSFTAANGQYGFARQDINPGDVTITSSTGSTSSSITASGDTNAIDIKSGSLTIDANARLGDITESGALSDIRGNAIFIKDGNFTLEAGGHIGELKGSNTGTDSSRAGNGICFDDSSSTGGTVEIGGSVGSAAGGIQGNSSTTASCSGNGICAKKVSILPTAVITGGISGSNSGTATTAQYNGNGICAFGGGNNGVSIDGTVSGNITGNSAKGSYSGNGICSRDKVTLGSDTTAGNITGLSTGGNNSGNGIFSLNDLTIDGAVSGIKGSVSSSGNDSGNGIQSGNYIYIGGTVTNLIEGANTSSSGVRAGNGAFTGGSAGLVLSSTANVGGFKGKSSSTAILTGIGIRAGAPGMQCDGIIGSITGDANGIYDEGNLDITVNGTLSVSGGTGNTAIYCRGTENIKVGDTGIVNITNRSAGDEDDSFSMLNPGGTWSLTNATLNSGNLNATSISAKTPANTTSTIKIADSQFVCQIGSTEYTSLDDALALVDNGQTIKLLTNITDNDGLIIDSGKHFTINLSGHVLAVNNLASFGKGLTVENMSAVDLTDSESGGAFDVTGSYMGVLADNGAVTLTSATATANPSYGATARNGGVIRINDSAVGFMGGVTASGTGSSIHVGGDVTGTGPASFGASATAGGEVTVDGTITAGSYYVLIAGNAMTNDSENWSGLKPKTGYHAFSDGTSTVWVMAGASYEAEIGGTQYASLDEAIADVPAGGATNTTIILLQNITHTSPVVIDGKKIYFDLNGFDLTIDTRATNYSTALNARNVSDVIFNNAGKLKISGSRYGVYAYGYSHIALAGDVVATGGTHPDSGKYPGTGVYVSDNSTVTIDGSVTGDPLAEVNGIPKGPEDGINDPGKPGYIKYTNNSNSAVWVKAPSASVWPAGNSLTASGTTDTGTVLTWTAATGARQYYVLKGNTNLGTMSADILTYTVTGLLPDTEYTFQVQAAYLDVATNTGKWTTDGPSVTVRTAQTPPVNNYSITVQTGGNGTASANVNSAAQGTEITLTASPQSGYQFKEWQVISGGVSIANNKFIMPAANVTVRAIFEPIPAATYAVTVSGSYAGTTGAGSYAQGSAVTIHAGSRSNYSFTGWTSPDEVNFTNAGSATTTFTMPAKNVSVTANWSYKGGGGGSSEPSTPTYKADVKAGNNAKTTIPVAVDKDARTASIDAGSQNLAQGGTVIKVPSIPDVDAYSVGIPVPDLSTTVVQGTLTLDTDKGSVTVSSNMLTGVAGISGSKAQITIGQGNRNNLPADVKAAIGDRPLVQLTLAIDGKQTNWSNPAAHVTVSIPYTPTAAELTNPESIVIWYIDGSGNVVTIPNSHYDATTGTVTFQTTHFSDYAVVYNKVSFNDVASGAWYNKAVSFIAAREITGGTGNGNYSPDAKLTRGEFIVLMMRAYDIAPNTSPIDNFSDAGNTYYTGYLASAKRLGITNGVGNNMYAPGKEITRQEMFTLLYNALKVIGRLPQGDSGKTLADFSDAGKIDSWAQEAMTMLVKTGTVGGSGGKLTPTGTTTRAEMAQVLYNLLGK